MNLETLVLVSIACGAVLGYPFYLALRYGWQVWR